MLHLYYTTLSYFVSSPVQLGPLRPAYIYWLRVQYYTHGAGQWCFDDLEIENPTGTLQLKFEKYNSNSISSSSTLF